MQITRAMHINFLFWFDYRITSVGAWFLIVQQSLIDIYIAINVFSMHLALSTR